MKTFQGRTAVITGAGSGFGLELSRLAAAAGMNLVMADVQQDALDRAVDEIRTIVTPGAKVMGFRLDVAKAAEVESMGEATRARFAELEYLERSIGATGLLAIKPFLHMSRKDLWQLYQIGR